MIARPLVLVAAPASVIRQLRGAIGAEAEVIGAETWDEAIARLREQAVSLIVLCYAFDEMRPFRLVHYLEREWQGEKVPVILVRALAVPLGKTQEAEIRESYQTLGVDEFINLYDNVQQVGTAAALGRFRDSVFRRLPGKAGQSAPGAAPRALG